MVCQEGGNDRAKEPKNLWLHFAEVVSHEGPPDEVKAPATAPRLVTLVGVSYAVGV